jgi:hypothetical protein
MPREVPFHVRAFIQRLQQMGLAIQRAGAGWLAQCPGHPDRTPSLSIGIGDEEKILLNDHSKHCTPEQICQAMGGDITMLFPAREQTRVYVGEPEVKPAPAPQQLGTPVSTYVYTDERGTPLFHVIRLLFPDGRKGFKQCRPDGAPGIEGVRRVLYRLHEWQGKKKLAIVEGEKDADALVKWGIPATTNMGGANSWRPEYIDQIKAAGIERLVVFGDNDEPGRRHAHLIAAEAHRVGIHVRVIIPPGVPEKGDISDWIAAGGTKEQLVRIVNETKQWAPGDAPAPEKKRIKPRGLGDLTQRKPDYLIEGVLPEGMFGEIAGRDGRGKSLLGLEIAKALLTGQPLFGEFKVKKTGPVLLVCLDDPEWLVRDRLETLGFTPETKGLHILTENDVDMTGDRTDILQQIAEWCVDIKPVFVLIDALYIFVPVSKGSSDPTNNQGIMKPIMESFNAIANASAATVALVAHENKAGTDVQGSQSIRNMAKWILRLALPAKYEKDISGGKVTPHRVLQLEKDKTGQAQQWGLRLEGPGKWVRCEIEEEKSKKEKKAELEAKIIEWLKFFLEPGPQPTAAVREASFMDGNRFPWHLVSSQRVADEAGVEKTHASPEAPWMWSLRKEESGVERSKSAVQTVIEGTSNGAEA